MPADLLVRVHNYARAANVSVTAWVELALAESLQHPPQEFTKRLSAVEEMSGRKRASS